MTQAVFKSTSQALHFSYLIEFEPAAGKSIMQAMYEEHLKATGKWVTIPAEERTIDFGGLSPLEIRGQCAMVRASAEHRLVYPEANAVRAHYGMQTTKAAGIRGLVEYVAPMLTIQNDMTKLAMAWGHLGTIKQRKGLTQIQIAEYYGVPVATVQRDQKKIAEVGRLLLKRAIDGLDVHFKRTELVLDEALQTG